MHILIGLVLGCVLLYFWLVGHWFARVLFVPIATIAVFVAMFVAMVGNSHENVSHPAETAVALVIGLIAGWVIAGIPTRYWRKRARLFNHPLAWPSS